MARAEINDRGDMELSVHGTDVNEVIWTAYEMEDAPDFPGFGLGHRLIERGYMPDRSNTSWHASGWLPVGRGGKSWVIPCYRRDSGATV